MNAVDDFRAAIERSGLAPPALIPPGKLIRFPGIGKSNGNTSGWARFFEDEARGVYGDWSSGLSEIWQAKRTTPMTQAEQAANRRRVAELQRLRAEEEARMNAAAAEYAQTLCEVADLAPADHPYLIRKGIQPHGLRLDSENRLIVPVSINSSIASVQFIDSDGVKRFLPDGAIKGGSYIIGTLTEAGPLLIAEGFSTAASLYEATGYPTVVAFSAGNLLPVAQQLRQQFPSAVLLLCADNDVRTDGTPNTGVEAATKAARAINGIVAIPEAISNSKADWNDVHVKLGLDTVRNGISAALKPRVTILDEVFSFLGRFVSYPSVHAQIAHTLWIAHTHLMELWESTPRLAFLSPESGSGKTRALELTETLVPRPVEAVNVTSAYLFRKIADPDGLPTILHDEIDTVFGPRAQEHEEIRGVINAGHRRGASAGRCVLKGKVIVTEELSAYCAVALAGIGNLPDTILTRSVIIRMRRKAPREVVEPYRRRVHAREGNRLRDKLAAWATEIRQTVNLYPVMPEGVTDRNADVWESLLSIADAVGGNVAVVAVDKNGVAVKSVESWPKIARVAAVALVAVNQGEAGSLGVRLLWDMKTVFVNREEMATEEILPALMSVEESPWGDLKGKPLDARRLAHLLRPYGISSRNVRVGGKIFKGYATTDLFDAWTRYGYGPMKSKEINGEGEGRESEAAGAFPQIAATTATRATTPMPIDEEGVADGPMVAATTATRATTPMPIDEEGVADGPMVAATTATDTLLPIEGQEVVDVD